MATANYSTCVNGGAFDDSSGACVCPMGTADEWCQTDVGDAMFHQIYQAFIWSNRVGYAFLLALAVWRTLAVLRALASSMRVSAVKLQLSIALSLLATAAILFALSFDPLSREGVFNVRVSNALINAGDTLGLLTTSLTVRVFVDIQARTRFAQARLISAFSSCSASFTRQVAASRAGWVSRRSCCSRAASDRKSTRLNSSHT